SQPALTEPAEALDADEPASAPVTVVPVAHAELKPIYLRPLVIAAGSALVAGCVAAAVGTYFGAQFLTTPHTAPSGVSQLAYLTKVNSANHAAIAADVSLGVAGALGSAALTLILIEVLRHPTTEAF